MDFKFEYVKGHVEVFDSKGRFLFSADTETEARYEIIQLYIEKSA